MKFHDVQKKPSRYPLVVRLRVSVDDMEAIKQRALAKGETVSSYLRKRGIGARMPGHIQNLKDIAQLRQHFGLLKHLMQTNPDNKAGLEPLLDAISSLIASMRRKVGL